MLSKTCKVILFCAGLLAVAGLALAQDSARDDLIQKNGATYGPGPKHMVPYAEQTGAPGKPELPPGVGIKPIPGIGGSSNQALGGPDGRLSTRGSALGGISIANESPESRMETELKTLARELR